MEIALLVILLALLAVVVVQDFKRRAISWFLIPLLLIGFIGLAFLQMDATQLLTYIGINLYIVFSTLLGATFIISIKNKKLTNIVNTYLGLGDVLFFVVLATVFSPINFILFFIGSIFISTIIFGGITLFSKKQILTPLAGAMSVLLIIVMVAVQFTPTLDFYQDIIFFF
jgi:Flp pilus assembly protein protease CpaA